MDKCMCYRYSTFILRTLKIASAQNKGDSAPLPKECSDMDSMHTCSDLDNFRLDYFLLFFFIDLKLTS